MTSLTMTETRAFDGASFTALMEALRRTLAAHQPSPRLEAPAAYDTAKLLDAVTGVVSAASRVTLAKDSPWAPPNLPLFAREPELHRIIAHLEPAWLQLVTHRIGTDKRRLLNALLRQPAFDLLGVLGKEDEENAHSDVMRWLLDPQCAHTIAPELLVALTSRLQAAEQWERSIRQAVAAGCISVRREYVVGDEWAEFGLDRIDLVVSGPDFIIAIENKVWAIEHNGQTSGYWKWLSSLSGQKVGFLLSPRGVAPACSGFETMSYLEFIGCLLEGPLCRPMEFDEKCVVRSYFRTLASHVLRCELRAVQESEGAS